MRASFNCFSRLVLIEKRFCQKLSAIAKSYDSRIEECAFKVVKGFAESRQQSNLTDKQRAATQLNSVLAHLFQNKMTSNLSDLRVNCLRKKQIYLVTHTWFNRQRLIDLRRSFMRWRASAGKLAVVEDVNE